MFDSERPYCAVSGRVPNTHKPYSLNRMHRIFCTCLLLASFSGLAFAVPSPSTLQPLITGLGICGAISIDAQCHIWISEWANRRVGIYDQNGKQIGMLTGIGDPSGNVFDDKGNFYVSAYSLGRVYQISSHGESRIYADGFQVPAGLAWIDGGLSICNRDAGELVRIEWNGTQTVLARGMPRPVSCLRLSDGAIVISCLGGPPHILESDGKLDVLLPEIGASGINIIPDGDNRFIFCVISDGTVERVTLSGPAHHRTARREVLASGFSTSIGVARLPDGRIIFDAWGQGSAYVLDPRGLDPAEGEEQSGD